VTDLLESIGMDLTASLDPGLANIREAIVETLVADLGRQEGIQLEKVVPVPDAKRSDVQGIVPELGGTT
jgi:hypothetical protein